MQQLVSIQKSLEEYQKNKTIPPEEELKKIFEQVKEISANNPFLNSMFKNIEKKIQLLKQREN